MFKRGDVYWLCIRYKGKKRQISLETGNKKLAKEIEVKLKAEILEGKYFDRRETLTVGFAEFMDMFIAEHAPLVSSGTRRSYQNSKKHLLAFFQNQQVSDISPKNVSAFKAKRIRQGAKPATINRERAMLSKAFNVAIREWEWNLENPVSKVSTLRENNERDRWLTKKEAEKLVSHCFVQIRSIVVFAMNTGMRQDEILSLEWPDVSLANRSVVVMRSKNNRRRTIPLSDSAMSVLKEQSKVRHLNSRLVFPNKQGKKVMRYRLSRSFKKAAAQAGIENFRFHDLRHCCATWLAQAGHDIYFIARWLGHRDISMTQRYAHHCVDSLRVGVSAVNSDYNLTTIGGNLAVLEGSSNAS